MKAVSQTYRWPFETAGKAVSREEVDAAWTAYRTRPTTEARDVIVERYIHLVRYMARRLGRALPPSVDADDLVGAGIEGFLRADEVATLVSGLPRGQQLVLQLYYVEDLNFREIAMIMDISESRATQLHTAAVQALRSDGGCLEAAGALAIA